MHPFDDFRALLEAMPRHNDLAEMMVAKRWQENLSIEPENSQMSKLAAFYLGWRGLEAEIQAPLLAIFAGSHGFLPHKLQSSLHWTEDMVKAFAENKAPVNYLCQAESIHLKIFDLALAYPTMDFTKDAALDTKSAAATMAYGMEAIAGNVDVLLLSGFGNGAAFSNAAIAFHLYGGYLEEWIEPQALNRLAPTELAAIKARLTQEKDLVADPLESLRYFGGREIAALVGAILAARMEKIPVILEGYSAFIAGAVLHQLKPDSIAHCLFVGQNQTPPQKNLAKILKRDNFYNFDEPLGYGINGILLTNILRNAVKLYHNLRSVPNPFSK